MKNEETTPAVIGALGLIKDGLKKHLEKIPGVINIKNYKKQLIRNSTHTKEGLS